MGSGGSSTKSTASSSGSKSKTTSSPSVKRKTLDELSSDLKSKNDSGFKSEKSASLFNAPSTIKKTSPQPKPAPVQVAEVKPAAVAVNSTTPTAKAVSSSTTCNQAPDTTVSSAKAVPVEKSATRKFYDSLRRLAGLPPS